MPFFSIYNHFTGFLTYNKLSVKKRMLEFLIFHVSLVIGRKSDEMVITGGERHKSTNHSSLARAYLMKEISSEKLFIT